LSLAKASDKHLGGVDSKRICGGRPQAIEGRVKTYDEMVAAEAAQWAHDETLKQDAQKVEEISSRINAAAAAAGRQCGDCTMCCKVLPIEELSKPAHQWCQHAKPGSGCAIYQSRPPNAEASLALGCWPKRSGSIGSRRSPRWFSFTGAITNADARG
jgi:hypothetical protein